MYVSLYIITKPQVKANGLIVFVPKFGIEGPVYLTPNPSSSSKDKGGAGGGKGGTKGGKAQKQASDVDALFVLDEEAQVVTSR